MMMLDIEEIMCELEGAGEDQLAGGGGGGSLMPPGFRFHPTDEELITYYLASKVFINDTYNLSAAVDIPQVDLNRCEPWELPDVAKMGEREWYFYSMRDRKYPTGLRTNRATGAGYWKATGKDKEVYSSSGSGSVSGGSGKGLLGMKKTLVFYKGRAPRGEKTKWVMHEYRLDGDFSCRHTCKEEWVICRIFHKMGEKKHGGFIMNTTNIHEGQSLYHHQHQLQEEEQHPPHPSSPTTTTTNSLPAVVPLLESTTTPSLSSLLLESPNPATIPPPLMMLQQQHIQNPNFLFQHHHENDLRSLITSPLPSLFPTITGCCFQTNDPSPKSNITNSSIINITPTIDNKNNTETNASPSPSSSLLRSLLSNQDYFTSTTIPKQCKTEAIFSQIDHLPLPDHHSSLGNNWGGLDKTNPTHQITYSSFFASSSCQYPISNLGVDFRVNATVGFPSSLLAEGVGTKLAGGGGTTTTTTSSLAFNKSGFSRCPWI